MIIHSHCDTCKLTSGSAFTLNQIVPSANLNIVSGKEGLHTYNYKGDSGKNVACYFCSNCGTHVYHHQEAMGDKLIAKTMSLEGAKDFPPGVEVYGKARLPWVKEVAHTFDMMPPS